MRRAGAALIVISTLTATTTSASAASCATLIGQGAKIIDTYVMDFGPADKLYVYILRMRSGATEKCTSQRPLRTQRR